MSKHPDNTIPEVEWRALLGRAQRLSPKIDSEEFHRRMLHLLKSRYRKEMN
jgi:hypothetical protein